MATTDLRAVAAALAASVGAFLFGLDIGYIAPILECASFKKDVAHLPDWADPDSRIPSGTAGFMVGIFSLGCIASSFPVVSSYFLDQWGRRSSIMVGSGVFLAGCVIQARAMSLAVMYVGRLVTGGAIGLLSSVVPLYQAEMAPPAIRGALTSLYQLMLTSGIFVAALMDQVLVWRDDGWRIAIWLQMVPALFILLWMPFLPRSPRWLVQQGRSKEAEETLVLLRGKDAGLEELEEIVGECEAAKARGTPRWRDLFTGNIGRLVALGSVMQLLQQLVGMNAFMYFGPRIFGSFGLQENLFQTINNAVNCCATLPAIYLVDKSGRKPLLVLGALGMGLACVLMGILGCAFITKTGKSWTADSDIVAGAMAALVFLFVMCFACTWGPAVWVYCCEIYPLKYRARCVGVTTTMNWIGNYAIAQFAPMLLDSIGFSTFFVFAGFCGVALGVALWLPETKGLMLEHIAQQFDERFGGEAEVLHAGKDYGTTPVCVLVPDKRA